MEALGPPFGRHAALRLFHYKSYKLVVVFSYLLFVTNEEDLNETNKEWLTADNREWLSVLVQCKQILSATVIKSLAHGTTIRGFSSSVVRPIRLMQ